MILRILIPILLALPLAAGHASAAPDQRLFCQSDTSSEPDPLEGEEEEQEPDCD